MIAYDTLRHVNRLIVLVTVDICLCGSVNDLVMLRPSLRLVFMFIAIISLGVLLPLQTALKRLLVRSCWFNDMDVRTMIFGCH
jgi:hypothetical protein